ncbi:hypothetical protein [Nocardioides sp. MH1]|uniref:hypothetical protein n=1 Tax=Nocardioides sp. MH1 TaxID=3242490 RepID=UPI00352235C8
MPESTPTTQSREDHPPLDVFAAAHLLDSLWNSSAKAVAPDAIEWRCNTWGSGRGAADWLETATFDVVTAALDLHSWRNRGGRDELVVAVPLERAVRVVRLIERLEKHEPEAWPWCDVDVEDPVGLAAEVLGLSPAEVAANDQLMEALRLL